MVDPHLHALPVIGCGERARAPMLHGSPSSGWQVHGGPDTRKAASGVRRPW
ncbi:Hypothetical protein AA314_04688 [Archangium gephyra]|uniref:Uncharacterized protein n=1 Tax=Archangium gephyra TaxID=48 RepID=A0AAC8TEK8_9BACT|nr:Hypothetical protein AA314_04688 [Archangium gephyra]